MKVDLPCKLTDCVHSTSSHDRCLNESHFEEIGMRFCFAALGSGSDIWMFFYLGTISETISSRDDGKENESELNTKVW